MVIGGAHASIFPELTLKDNNVDIVAYGEGEATFLDLVKQARENPSDEIKETLISIEYHLCDGKSDHVLYARYLQHSLTHLKHEGN